MSQRSCYELGVCQGKNPACNGCDWKTFAPGTIEGPFRRTRKYLLLSRMSRRAKVVLVVSAAVLALACVSMVTGFSAGYLIYLPGVFK